MQLSENFSLEELIVTTTGIDNTPDPKSLQNLYVLAQGLEQVRKLLGSPIKVSSAYRSAAVNKAVKGAKSSQHLLGLAADITSPKFGTPTKIMEAIYKSNITYDQCILEYPEKGGWIHIGFSVNPRRQALLIDSTGTSTYEA